MDYRNRNYYLIEYTDIRKLWCLKKTAPSLKVRSPYNVIKEIGKNETEETKGMLDHLFDHFYE